MMLLLAAATAAASALPPPRSPAVAAVQARASVRIVAGARVRFESGGSFVMRDAVIRSGGIAERARLVEFE